MRNQDRNGWKNLDLDEQEVFVSRGFKRPEVADRSDQTGVYEFDEGF